MSTAVNAILASLRNDPDEWIVREFTLYHARTGLELWRSNGRFFVSIWKMPGSNEKRCIFSFWEKCHIYRAMQKIVNARAVLERADLERKIVALFSGGNV